ncbi:MAG: IS3 family transposase [Candidatus Hydrogenedentota bacterium]
MLAHAMEYSICMMSRVLNVSSGGYYAWKTRKPSRQQQRREELTDAVLTFHADTKGAYGYRKVHEDIVQTFEEPCCLETVRRIMKDKGLRSTRGRKFVVTTDSNHTMPVAENILDRNFESYAPNEKWVTDITFIPKHQGWTYLATVMDLFARRIVGWATSKRIDTALISEALHKAIKERQPGKGLLHHSDRGSQYASKGYRKTLKQFKMKCSMSRKGNCWDNAPMERFFSSLKSEWLRDKIFPTHEAATSAIFEYIETFYNPKRRHAALGYQSPIQYENNMKQQQPLAA